MGAVIEAVKHHTSNFVRDVSMAAAVAAGLSIEKELGPLRKRGAMFVRDAALATVALVKTEQPMTAGEKLREQLKEQARNAGIDVWENDFQPQRKRDFRVNFELRGRAGQTKIVQTYPHVLFRGEQVMAIDDSVNPGYGTYVVGFYVGHKPQVNPLMAFDGTGISTKTYAVEILDGATTFEVCDPALQMTFAIRFVEDCTWYATVLGKAVG